MEAEARKGFRGYEDAKRISRLRGVKVYEQRYVSRADY